MKKMLLPFVCIAFAFNSDAKELETIEKSCFEGAVETSIIIGDALDMTALERGQFALELNQACEDGRISFS